MMEKGKFIKKMETGSQKDSYESNCNNQNLSDF